VNPLTALNMIDIARKGGHKAFINTAGFSQLAKQVTRFAAKEGIKVINLVRKEEQVGILRD